jgi:hypothetical protein
VDKNNIFILYAIYKNLIGKKRNLNYYFKFFKFFFKKKSIITEIILKINKWHKMKQKPKILYIMHIDWNWIKQRPHFLAEGLNEYYDITVLYPISFKRWKLVHNSINGLKVNGFFIFPFDLNLAITDKLNNIHLMGKIQRIINELKPDLIWLTFPLLYDFLPKDIDIKIVYDCMDDAANFFDKKEKRKNVLNIEKELLKSSWKIFASSEKLKKEIINRSSRKDVKVVRNAFNGRIHNSKKIDAKTKKKYRIGFVGTISSWLDFSSLDYCVENIENIEFHLIGPQELSLSSAQTHKYVFYGSVEHSELIEIVKNFDCFILPFKLNDLTKSADPIKLYEYINYNKPIISIFYPEIKRFEKFVEFYRDKETLLDILNKLIKNKFKLKYSEKDRLKFLKANTWSDRVSEIVSTLHEKDC